MSLASGVGGGFSPAALQQLQQYLFNKTDGNGDGSVSQGELETAVTNAGGSTQAADALYSLLDPNGTGGFDEQQFAQAFPSSGLSDGVQAQLVGFQAQGWPGAHSSGVDELAQSLFSQIDTNGDGSISQSELEQAVTGAGGTKAAADALYAQLDPNGTGSVSEQQFAQGLFQSLPHGHHHHGFGAPPASANDSSGTVGSDGSSADDALTALFDVDGGGAGNSPTQIAQNIFSSVDTNGDGNITQTELEQAVTAAGGTTAGADALYAQLDPSGTGSVSEQQFVSALQAPAPGGNTATDALLALFDSVDPNDPTAASSSNSATTTSSTDATGTTAQDAVAALLQRLAPQRGLTPGTGSDTGNSVQDALLALLKGDSNTANGGAANVLSADLAQAFALYQGQLSQQFLPGIGAMTSLSIA
ncbi:MAG TPA: EF-hand domain-containing protein [Xanthobacteraceae bacterium]|nr:EF-hand domain-containing protein [Xanthobacteraceae bacterium]